MVVIKLLVVLFNNMINNKSVIVHIQTRFKQCLKYVTVNSNDKYRLIMKLITLAGQQACGNYSNISL